MLQTQVETIGIIGRQGAGKDFYTQRKISELVEQQKQGKVTSERIQIVRLADGLKGFSCKIFGKFMAESKGGVVVPTLSQYLIWENQYKNGVKNKECERIINAVKLKTDLYDFAVDIALLLDMALSTRDLRQKVALVFKPYEINDKMAYRLSPRLLQQLVGTEIVRAYFGQDTWVRLTDFRMQELIKQAELDNIKKLTIYCPDVRFSNEASLFDKLIYIHRQSTDNGKILSNEEIASCHPSENLCELVRREFLTHNILAVKGDIKTEDLGKIALATIEQNQDERTTDEFSVFTSHFAHNKESVQKNIENTTIYGYINHG